MTFMKLSSLVFLSSIITLNLHSMNKPQQAKTVADMEFEQALEALPAIADTYLSQNMFTRILDGSPDIATAELLRAAIRKPQKTNSTQTELVYQALNTPEAIAHYQKMHAYFLYTFMISTTPATPPHPASATTKGSEASNK